MKHLPLLISLFLISLSAHGVPLSRSRCADLLRLDGRAAMVSEDKASSRVAKEKRLAAQPVRVSEGTIVAQNQTAARR